MASTTCGDLEVTVTCGTQTEISFNNTAEPEQNADLLVPPGGKIYDPNGDLIYENTGGEVKKANIRIP